MFKKTATAGLLPALVVSAVLVMAFIAPGRAGQIGLTTYGCPYPYTGCNPTVTSVVPDRGTTAGGTSVTITGTHFTGATAVSFGGTPATSFVVVNDTTITAVAPAHVSATVDVQVTTAVATSAINAGDQYTFVAPSVFHPQQPLRILDTRSTGGHLHSGGSVTIQIAGTTAPADSTAVTLNVTVTNTTTAGFLTVYPTGSPRPLSSNLNWVAHQTVPNLVSVAIGSGGDVTFYNQVGTTDVVVDLEGWYEPQNVTTDGEFVSLPPARITDTRTGSGLPNAGHHLGVGGTVDVQVTGAGGVPLTGAESVVVNVTATDTTFKATDKIKTSVLIAYPTGSSRPLASNLNWKGNHQTVANRVSVPIGAGGKITLYNAKGKVDVVVDVNGYYTDATATGGFFLPLTPVRILDTRDGNGGFSTPVGPGQTISVQIDGRGGVPASGVSEVILNVTATDPTGKDSFLTIFPDLTSLPNASDLNFVRGQTVANLVFVKVGTDGKVAVYNPKGTTEVIFDVAGWFS
jgi:hypothetical protein